MADVVSTLKRLRDLPPAVQDFIFAEDEHERGGKVIDRNALNDAQTRVVFGLIKELYLRDIALNQLVPEIVKRFGFDEEKSKRLAADIAGYQLLPLDKWLADVDGYLRGLGADPKLYPPNRIQVAMRSADEATEEVLKSVGSEATAEIAFKKRQEELVKSYFSGIRTDAQLKEALTRPAKVGGLGMELSQAERFLEAVVAEKNAVLIESYSPGATSMTDKKEQAPTQADAPKPAETFVTVRPEDEDEIKRLMKQVQASTPNASQDTARKIEESIRELYAASGYVAHETGLEKRLKTVIGNRLRDVRDSMETLEALTQTKDLGGIGMSEADARGVLARIEAKLREVHEAHRLEVQADKRKWAEGEASKHVAAEEATKRKDETEREALFSKLLEKTGKAPAVKAETARPLTVTPAPIVATIKAQAAASAAPVALATKVAPPPPNLPIATVNPVPPPMRPPVIIPPLERPSPTPRAPTPEVPGTTVPGTSAGTSDALAAPARPPLTIVRPTTAPPMSPPVSTQGGMARPKMEDVKPVLQLTGPVEELRSMSLVDFRRLSRDPKEACAKIMSKIDLLRQDSYGKRNDGIAAWGGSEVHQTYLELMREALAGKPLTEVAKARSAAGKASLSAEELAAVADLNRQLRY